MTLSVTVKNGGRRRVAAWTLETTAGNSGIAVHEPDISAVVSSLQVAGTFGGATVTFLGSNDGTNFAALAATSGAAISLTAAGIVEMSTALRYVKPNISGGTGDSLNITFVYWD